MLRKGLPPLPDRIKALPIDSRGYPIPWFVAEIEPGVRDFRFADRHKRVIAARDRRCWVCSDKLGRYLAFVIGPMCAINRNTSEPACHRECAEFAVRACPFMLLPQAQYRKANAPDSMQKPIGFLDGNPGCMCIWITTDFKPYRAGPNRDDWLILIGNPIECLWYAGGELATRKAVLESIERRLPLLREVAEQHDGPEGVALLEQLRDRALALVPA
ncbi:MAG: hypothetical protein ACREUX_13910 [Burkholderiales bacterium]